jgi:hypothetical protein
MKKIITYLQSFSLSLMLIGFSACSNSFYQVLETTSNDAKLQGEQLVYENSEVKLTYNFWSNNGQIGFLMFNKTDKPIFIDWDKSHLIHNGISYDYWNDTEKTNAYSVSKSGYVNNVISNTVSLASGTKATMSEMTTAKPKKIVHVPPRSAVSVNTFNIQSTPFYDCDFKLRYSSAKNLKVKTFDKASSPAVFRNYITYSDNANADNYKIVDNEFYVSSIKNVSYQTFEGKSKIVTICTKRGEEYEVYKPSYPYRQPNSFFIQVVSQN